MHYYNTQRMLIISLSLTISVLSQQECTITPERAVRQLVQEYAQQQHRCPAALHDWLRHVRALYPCNKRPVPITILDRLTAADIIFITKLIAIAREARYATESSTSWPSLTPGGRSLFKLAEHLILRLDTACESIIHSMACPA